ncbi:hypothetical protein [Bradyrhizobium sp. RT3b]|uniref:hypothetical protein n=1 Tax=Bradyrhizobium sp. RT3b TaxID=3156334 RepID=UPI00339185E4
MNLLQQHALEFERLCGNLLREAGYHVEEEVSAYTSHKQALRFDIVATLGDTKRFIDVKWTRNNPVTLKQLRDWSANLASAIRFYSAGLLTNTVDGSSMSQIGILIVSGMVDSSHREWLESEFLIEVWDRARIMTLTEVRENLRRDFTEAFRTLDSLHADLISARKQKSADQPAGLHEPERAFGGYNRGSDLISQLRSISPGRADAYRYEKLCVEIVEYLFGAHLLDARPQMRVEDGLNVLDLVYRVNPAHLFWETLTRDFRARIIIFECKNYSDPVGPEQVYSTERYLSTSALRPICFLLTRKPPHQHAELAAFGAMRESGKLMIFLSDDDLIEMLRVRDAQGDLTETSTDNDPTIILDQKIYDFISRLPR